MYLYGGANDGFGQLGSFAEEGMHGGNETLTGDNRGNGEFKD